MNADTTLDRLDDLIASRSILEHPFYQAWTAGELSREQLGTYARLYYPHVAAFPGYLETAAAKASNPEVKAELLDNLAEERAVPAPHPELWLDFAESMGLDRAEVASAAAGEATRETVAAFQSLAEGSTAGALAALYAYESQQPEVSKTKSCGLTDFYGVSDDKGLAYFTVHSEADVRHREGERQALATCLAEGASEAEVLEAADRALTAYWGLLDGVCREADIPLAC